MVSNKVYNRILEWLASQERSQAWLARKAGIARQRLSDFAAGRRGFSPEVADRISAATGGAITLRELLGLPSESQQERTAP